MSAFLASVRPSAFADLEPAVFSEETPPAIPAPATPGVSRGDVARLVSEEVAVTVAAKLAAVDERARRSREETDARLAEAIARVEAIARPRVAVLGVKFPGDDKPRKLSKEAHPLLPTILNTLKGVRPNVLLIGPKGSGKTTLAEQVSEAMQAPFGAFTLSAGISETHILGRNFNGQYTASKFVQMYENGGVFLLDELDRADANLACILNTALENGHFENPIACRTMKRHPDFYVVAAGNTNMRGQSPAYAGATRQDAALVERFFAMSIDYDRDLERRLVGDSALLEACWEARDSLQRINSTETVSTRSILTLERALAIGIPLETALYNTTLGWAPAALQAADLGKRIEKARKEGAA